MQMKTSSYEEKAIKLLLTQRATFAREKTFNDLRHGALRFDFYITKPFLAILEIDGRSMQMPDSPAVSTDILIQIPYIQAVRTADIHRMNTPLQPGRSMNLQSAGRSSLQKT